MDTIRRGEDAGFSRRSLRLLCGGWLPHDDGASEGCLALAADVGICLSNIKWACQESCVEGRFQLNPLLSGEPVAEHDGELRFGGGPLTWWHLPLSADLAQHQEQQLGGGLVVWEVAAATHCGA